MHMLEQLLYQNYKNMNCIFDLKLTISMKLKSFTFLWFNLNTLYFLYNYLLHYINILNQKLSQIPTSIVEK